MISSGPSLSMEKSVRGAPAESAKVKSPANAPTRIFGTSFNRLSCKANRRTARLLARACLQQRHKNSPKDSFPFGGILAELPNEISRLATENNRATMQS
jgi:hypothetical protein